MTISPELLNAYKWHRQQGNKAVCWPINMKSASEALAKARADVANNVKRYPYGIYPAVTYAKGESQKVAFVNDINMTGLRFVGNVEAEPGYRNGVWSKRKSCGWYVNDYGETCYGVVYQLPARKGVARFVAGYAMTDCITLDLSNIFESKSATNCSYEGSQGNDAAIAAACAADSMAQNVAEEEREYQTAWQAGNQFASLGEEIARERMALLEVLKERRAAKAQGVKGEAYKAICSALTRTVRDVLDNIQKARTEREKLKDGEHDSYYFWAGDKRLKGAFNDGACEVILT